MPGLPLSLYEREEISVALVLDRDVSWAALGRRVGRHPTTIAREVCGGGGRDAYRAAIAQQRAMTALRRPRPCRLATPGLLRDRVTNEPEARSGRTGRGTAAVCTTWTPRGKLGRVRWGDEDVRVERKSWRAARVAGYRQTYRLRPGDLWSDAPVTPAQYEHLVDVDGGSLPVGVMIARELVGDGADWAVMVELWGGAVLVDHRGVCLSMEGSEGTLLSAMRAANSGRWGGFADVVGARGSEILLREAKVAGKRDRLRDNQHAFMRLMRQHFGERIDAAIVEWDGA